MGVEKPISVSEKSSETFKTAPSLPPSMREKEKSHPLTLKEKAKEWISETGNQIPLSVVLAIIIGVVINSSTHVSPDIVSIVELPGLLWIRALKSIVIALIFTSMILSMQSLKKIPGGGSRIAKGMTTIFWLI